VRVDTVNELYARLDADTRLAAAITSGFGTIALVVATSGIYAVMAFLVAGRAREIAIRIALGADRGGVRRMVLQSSLRVVAAGAAIGIVAAVVAARAIASQLPGVTPTDPTTYLGVAGLLVVAAMAAAWWPARRASRVDPAVTLRGQ
jgi:ABC-type antimicrobial peptide transport system permease subunit